MGTIYFDIETAETKEIDIWSVGPPQMGVDSPQDTASTGAKLQGPGGDIVDGLQVQLWADKQVWHSGEVPELKANGVVLDEGELGFVDPPMGVFLEYDGVAYGIPAAGALSIGHAPIRGDMYGLGLKLNGAEYRNSNNQSFVLTPGKHTIRLILFAPFFSRREYKTRAS